MTKEWKTSREIKEEYNAHCTGEYRIYDCAESWGVTLISETTGDLIEIFWNTADWEYVNSLCGWKGEIADG